MNLYRIPLYRRSTGREWADKTVCREIDGLGMFVHYSEERELEPDFIRGQLSSIDSTWCVIEAGNVKQAIKIFHKEWHGAKIGGKGEKDKALWINRQVLIEELPFCERLHRNKKGSFICGEEVDECGNGEFGGCVLEHYDTPDDYYCPIGRFNELLPPADKRNEAPVKKVKVKGLEYLLIRAEDVMAEKAGCCA